MTSTSFLAVPDPLYRVGFRSTSAMLLLYCDTPLCGSSFVVAVVD